MSVFRYPKLLHKRTEAPPLYKSYASYKPFLQREFKRTCVYCQAVDTVAPGVVFGVDHYRPKSKFPAEATEYKNLFYCCSQCNSRKNNHWPFPEFVDTQTIPNPCAHVMTKHLRFRGAVVEAQSDCGTFTLKLLDLNDPKVVQFREHMIHMVDVLLREYQHVEELLEEIGRKEAKGKLSSDEASDYRQAVAEELSKIETSLSLYYGTSPLSAN